jgi:hypothetical protein
MFNTEKIRRLTEMGWPEIRFRLAQKLRILREQFGLTLGKGIDVDSQWSTSWGTERIEHQKLQSSLRSRDIGRAEELLPGYFANRTTGAFFWEPNEQKVLADDFHRRFPERAVEISREAEAIKEHSFRFFAYPEVSCGPKIPWRRDLIHGVETDLRHYARFSPLAMAEVGDTKIVWELNRHQHFFTLCHCYLLTGDESFAEESLSQWEDWHIENPSRRGINWASSLEVAFRSWSWIWMIYLLRGSRALSGKRLAKIVKALGENARFVAENLSTYFAPNTHLLGEGFSLFVTGLLFPELKGSAAWYESGRKILIDEIEKQVRKDGSHFEQSTFYHRYAIEFFLCAAILAERNSCPFPSEYLQGLEQMLEFLLHTSAPSGSHPSLGDSDGGRLIPFGRFNAEDHRPLLSTAAVFFRRPEFRRGLDAMHEQTLWLLGAAAGDIFDSLEPGPAEQPSRTFSDAGLITMRSDWSERAKFLLFDAGPQGMRASGHGHADSLSLVCSANGVDWCVDPGTYVYSSSRPWRDYFRSTAAHNTIVVDGQDQAVMVDWFKWRELPRVNRERSFSRGILDYAVGAHTGYSRLKKPVIHRRRILFARPDYWIVSDELSGEGHHKFETFFHFGPGIDVERTDQGWIAHKNKERFLLVPLSADLNCKVVKGEKSPIQGWYSADYGHREPASVLVGEICAAPPLELHWLLFPLTHDFPIFRELKGRQKGLVIETSQWTDYVVIGNSSSGDPQGEFATDAAVSFIRRNAEGEIERLVVLDGSSVWAEDKPVLKAEKHFEYFTAVWDSKGVKFDMSPEQPFRVEGGSNCGAQINERTASLVNEGEAIQFRSET